MLSVSIRPIKDVAIKATSHLTTNRPGGDDDEATLAPRLLHIDRDHAAALVLSVLLTPEARVTHVETLAQAHAMLREYTFAVVVIDPDLSDGDGADLLSAPGAFVLVVHAASRPHWHASAAVFLPKPDTSPRLLWTTITQLLAAPPPQSRAH